MYPQKSASGKSTGQVKALSLKLDNLNSIHGTHRGRRQGTQESCRLAIYMLTTASAHTTNK